jgi:hypothetical protein
MMGIASFDDLIKDGKATFVGDRKRFDQLLALMVRFSPNFEILPGSAPQAPAGALQPVGTPDLAPAERSGD